MRIMNNKIIRGPLAKIVSAIFAMLFVISLCFTSITPTVKADSDILISTNASNSNLGPGDVIKVDVVASRFPGITEFGPVIFNFDSQKAEFISYDQGKELGNFLLVETQKDGAISISGTDMAANISPDGNDEEAEASLYSDSPVILFTLTLRLFPESNGDINCWVSNVGDFLSLGEKVPARTGSGTLLPIRRTGPSSDATIASLKIRGASISPDFNPYITDYTCSVERSVTEVQVSVLASNLWSAIVIDGGQQLNFGENLIVIDVTAQDGMNHMRYTVHVIRRESNIPENSSLVDLDGNTYTFLDIPEEVSIPDGFYQTMITINNYRVPVYVKDGVTSVILYLFDGTQPPGFYFYNSSTKKVFRYEPESMVINDSAILKMAEVPSDITIPDEFKPATYDTGTVVLSGYENSDGDFICYFSDNDGKADFYFYDKETDSLSRYRFADKKAELLYSYLFDVFLVIAIIEAVIITITIYIVRRMVVERTNPRAKRV